MLEREQLECQVYFPCVWFAVPPFKIAVAKNRNESEFFVRGVLGCWSERAAKDDEKKSSVWTTTKSAARVASIITLLPCTTEPPFCPRTREEYDKSKTAHQELSIEQVRSATHVYLANTDLTRSARHQRLEGELDKQEYHRN